MDYLKVVGIPIAGTRITIDTDGQNTSVDGLPSGMEHRTGFRMVNQNLD
jgi:hypothetical protein